MAEEPARPAKLEFDVFLGIGIGGHAIAWALYALLGIEDDSPAIPGWAALLLHFSGREAILAVFSLAAMLPLYAAVQQYEKEGWPRVAKALGFVCAAVTLALAWRWYGQGRPVLTLLAALLAIPGLPSPGPKRPKPTE